MAYYVNTLSNDKTVIGNSYRYENIAPIQLPKVSESFVNVYEIFGESVVYGLIFDINSEDIYIQIEIDGQNIFPENNGFLLKDLKYLKLRGDNTFFLGDIGLIEYESNKWAWKPPQSVIVRTSFKLKMRSSKNSNKDLDAGIVIRRIL